MESNMEPRVIALCGKKRTGKDEIAKYLCEKHGYTNVKFAAPLKQALKALFGFTERQLEHDKEDVDAVWGITPRHAMQFFGSEVMQFQIQRLLPGIERGFFVKRLMELYPNQKIVISDMRFVHEYNSVCSLENSLVVKVNRRVTESANVDHHVSEIELDSINVDDAFTICNDGTLAETFDKMECILSMFADNKKSEKSI